MNKYRGLFLQRWAVLVLLWASAVGAAVPFTLRFGASGSMTIAMDGPNADLTSFQLGFRIGALRGDDSFDMPYPSITPPAGGVMLYFPADAPVRGLYQDFRPPAATESWQMELVGMLPGSSVTLRWRLQDGDLEGNLLSLTDRVSGTVLVENMMTTTSYEFTDTERSLLVLYTKRNHPPVARGDVAAMLQSAGSLQMPFDTLLANDYDPDAGDTIEVVAVGDPFVQTGGGKGTSAYGTTSLDADARMVTYTVPAVLPGDWDGVVYFPYTIRDNSTDLTTPHEGSATVEVTVAPYVLTIPAPTQVATHPGMPVTVAYTLIYTGSLNSLVLSFILPLSGVAPSITFWPYGGSYADNAVGTPDPAITTGAGPDGLWGTADDTGEVKLDFGTNVPPSGTIFSFVLNAPASATDAALPSLASYKTAADAALLKQPLPEVALRIAYTVTFASAGHGTVSGAASQLLEPGHLSTQISAEAATGYHFLRWTQGGIEISRANPLTVAGGNADLTITAEFEIDTYTITFGVLGSGTLNGPTPQHISYLGSTAPVLAVPGADSYFYQWTDGNADNPRTITGVAATATYTAEFRPLTPGAPDGHFELVFQNQTGGLLRHIWNLTGVYVTTLGVGGPVLTLDLTHDERGMLSGVGQLQGTVGGQAFTVSNMPVRGSSTGRNGSLTVRGGVAGANVTTSVSLRLSLAIAGRTLTGVVTGVVTNTVGGRLVINTPCVLDLPAAMDGTYRLPTDLHLGARGVVTGTSTLTLSNGRTVALLVKGKRSGGLTTLEFFGNKAADPAFGAVSFKLTVRTYNNGMAGIRALAGNAFGQILSWHL